MSRSNNHTRGKHAAAPVKEGTNSHSKQRRAILRWVVLSLLIVGFVVAGLYLYFQNSHADDLEKQEVLVQNEDKPIKDDKELDSKSAKETPIIDKHPSADPPAAEPAEEQVPERTPNPLIATYYDVAIASPIAPEKVNGVLFHQASYAWALPLSTQLPQADSAAAAQAHYVRVNNSQTEGEWLDADALHIWRTGEDTAMDTSIDVGAWKGEVVYAPVTGTVVLLANYTLFDALDDIEIHIQPDGHPELDCVVLHTANPLVHAGDHVIAGVTQLSYVRDIAAKLDGIQLTEFTPEIDPGNHAHVQINNADYEGYRERKLPGAITVQ